MGQEQVSAPLRGVRVVIGAIGDDIHVVGITILGHALRNAGAEVIQLGVQTPPEEFVATAAAEDADIVMISSSNGHAAVWCEGLRAALDAAGCEDALLYAGGNLAVSAQTPWPTVERQFLDMGFDRVFSSRTKPQDAIDAVALDVKLGEL